MWEKSTLALGVDAREGCYLAASLFAMSSRRSVLSAARTAENGALIFLSAAPRRGRSLAGRAIDPARTVPSFLSRDPCSFAPPQSKPEYPPRADAARARIPRSRELHDRRHCRRPDP